MCGREGVSDCVEGEAVQCISKLFCENSCPAHKMSTRANRDIWISVSWYITELPISGKWRGPDAHMSKKKVSSSVDTTVAVFLLAAELWDQCCDGIVQHGTVAGFRSSKDSKSYKSTKSSSYWHSGCLVSRNRSCDGRCMPRGHDVILHGTRQISVICFRTEPQTCIHQVLSTSSFVSPDLDFCVHFLFSDVPKLALLGAANPLVLQYTFLSLPSSGNV